MDRKPPSTTSRVNKRTRSSYSLKEEVDVTDPHCQKPFTTATTVPSLPMAAQSWTLPQSILIWSQSYPQTPLSTHSTMTGTESSSLTAMETFTKAQLPNQLAIEAGTYISEGPTTLRLISSGSTKSLASTKPRMSSWQVFLQVESPCSSGATMSTIAYKTRRVCCCCPIVDCFWSWMTRSKSGLRLIRLPTLKSKCLWKSA